MSNNPFSLLNVTGQPSAQGLEMVRAQQYALDLLKAGHPKHDGSQDGPQTAENKMLLDHIAAINK
jgi:hypothetical protein